MHDAHVVHAQPHAAASDETQQHDAHGNRDPRLLRDDDRALRQHEYEVVCAMDEDGHGQCEQELVQAHVALAQELAVTQVDADHEAGAAVEGNGEQHPCKGYKNAVHRRVLEVLRCSEARRCRQPVHYEASWIHYSVLEEDPSDCQVLQQLLQEGRPEEGGYKAVEHSLPLVLENRAYVANLLGSGACMLAQQDATGVRRDDVALAILAAEVVGRQGAIAELLFARAELVDAG
mmetsp:Transcript_101646/g.282916  ORF Transcript_101646/g.282916 Transcript_101646/m.282916 type:complete len:233 (+) Transcript_101646:616-1314(+)